LKAETMDFGDPGGINGSGINGTTVVELAAKDYRRVGVLRVLRVLRVLYFGSFGYFG